MIQIPTVKRTDLLKEGSWQGGTIELLVSGSRSTPVKRERIPVMTAYVAFELSPERAYLAVVRDPHSAQTFIVRAGQDFYLSDGTELFACAVDGGSFYWSKSYLRVPTSPGDSELAIARFVEQADDRALADYERAVSRVDLRRAAPLAFFTAQSAGGSQPGKPTIEGLELESGVLRLDLVSPLRRYQGSFWIDLRAGTLIRSVIDGKETDLHVW